jgi:hypothetical protein
MHANSNLIVYLTPTSGILTVIDWEDLMHTAVYILFINTFANAHINGAFRKYPSSRLKRGFFSLPWRFIDLSLQRS